ncbi:MAG: zinc-binding dehydrogenase [Clostridia bacterium]|nr:zinc-binding dehydrogenase [Clostridia bacterium]
MKTKAVRLYGKKDLRLEEFPLPEIRDDEILARVVSDSICMSSYKASVQGAEHKRVPSDVAENPVIIGHEFCGELIKVGAKWASQYKEGSRFVIQPALNYKGSLDAPGYSYKYIGGDATYIIIPNEVMLMDCLLPYSGTEMYKGSLTEPFSCVIGAFNASYHTTRGEYTHKMGILEGGCMAILAGAGPMGLATIDYAIHGDKRPSRLVVTDINAQRLKRAESIFTVQEAKEHGVELIYLNTWNINAAEKLKSVSPTGFDDVFVMAPNTSLVETADKILANDGCINFFAGPTDPTFSAPFNFFNVHYASTHVVGTSGGNASDMKEALSLISDGRLNPAALVTHIGGLDCVIDTTLNLPQIQGGKKLIYTGISLPLTEIDSFEALGKTDPMFKDLYEICKENNGLWCAKAEEYLLRNAKGIS